MSGKGNPTTEADIADGAVFSGLLTGDKWSETQIRFSFPNSISAFNYDNIEPEEIFTGDRSPFGVENNLETFEVITEAQKQAVRFALDRDSVDSSGSDPLPSSGFSIEAITKLTVGPDPNPNSDTAHVRYGLTDTVSDFTSAEENFRGGAVADFADTFTPAYFNGQILLNPNHLEDDGDIWLGKGLTAPQAGNLAWYQHLHETGHALGLQHPQYLVPPEFDAMEFSILNYRAYLGGWLSPDDGERPEDGAASQFEIAEGNLPQTYMMLDIAALQDMYDADFSFRGSNPEDTLYSWRPDTGNTFVNGDVAIDAFSNVIFATIWDAEGLDTYDLSAYTDSVTISLIPGEASTFADDQLAVLGSRPNVSQPDDPDQPINPSGSVYNALLYNDDTRSLIENAIGGRGNDTITGNQGQNTLNGGPGNDTLLGGMANDTLRGGAGFDVLDGQDGSDTVESSGILSDYDFSVDFAGNALVTETLPGLAPSTDTLVDVEKLVFRDIEFELRNGTSDGDRMFLANDFFFEDLSLPVAAIGGPGADVFDFQSPWFPYANSSQELREFYILDFEASDRINLPLGYEFRSTRPTFLAHGEFTVIDDGPDDVIIWRGAGLFSSRLNQVRVVDSEIWDQIFVGNERTIIPDVRFITSPLTGGFEPSPAFTLDDATISLNEQIDLAELFKPLPGSLASADAYEILDLSATGVVSVNGNAIDASHGYLLTDLSTVHLVAERFPGDQEILLRAGANDAWSEWQSLSFTTISKLEGSNLDDRLVGTDFGDIIDGLNGDDRYYGRGGNDTFVMGRNERDDIRDFEPGMDRIDLTAWGVQSFAELKIGGRSGVIVFKDIVGGDTGVAREITGALEPNSVSPDAFLFAPTMSTNVVGTAAADRLFGRSGDDLLDGLADNDRYYGGAGSDTFVMGANERDDIRDFEHGTDVIDISAWGLQGFEDLTIFGRLGLVLFQDSTTTHTGIVRDTLGLLDPESITADSFFF